MTLVINHLCKSFLSTTQAFNTGFVTLFDEKAPINNPSSTHGYLGFIKVNYLQISLFRQSGLQPTDKLTWQQTFGLYLFVKFLTWV